METTRRFNEENPGLSGIELERLRTQGPFELEVRLFRGLVDLHSDMREALRLTHRLIRAGLLVVPAGERVIRLLPPLNVTAEECHEALRILRDVLAAAEPLP